MACDIRLSVVGTEVGWADKQGKMEGAGSWIF